MDDLPETGTGNSSATVPVARDAMACKTVLRGRRAGVLAPLACAGALAACAGTGRTLSYGLKQADARVPFAGRTYSVYVHPSENTLLVQPSFADAFPMALANKESISATGARQILEQFLRGTSCTMTEPKFVSEATFESEYSCAPGFDLRATMRSQRAQLVKGSPLRGDR